jgi:hypothetical protein
VVLSKIFLPVLLTILFVKRGGIINDIAGVIENIVIFIKKIGER